MHLGGSRMELFRKEVSELEDGDYIGDNIERNKMIIVKRGVKVTEKLKQRLISLGVKRVTVFRYDEEDETNNKSMVIEDDTIKKRKKYHEVTDLMLDELFYETLFEVAHESRYGFSLQTVEDFNYVKQLFIVIGKNGDTYENLMLLKEWDYYSYIHTFDVFILLSLFARYLNVNNRYDVSKASLLYNVGKLKVPQEILQKSDKLTEEEMDVIRMHPVWGYEMLGDDVSEDVKKMVLNHQELLDGSGYPNRLSGDEISRSTRLLTVVDVYSALTLERVDRIALSSPRALKYLIKNKELFDEKVVTKFIDFLSIYPLNSIVKLTNKKKAKVVSVYENVPHLPRVKELHSKYTYNLPSNLSTKVFEFLSWDEDLLDEEKWSEFIKFLIIFNEKKSYQIFTELSADKKTDEVYSDVIMPAIDELIDVGVDPAICDRIFLKWMKEKSSFPDLNIMD